MKNLLIGLIFIFINQASGNTFRVISNESVPCDSYVSQTTYQQAAINPENMQTFMNELGWNYRKEYAASTREESLRNFPNLLNLRQEDSNFIRNYDYPRYPASYTLSATAENIRRFLQTHLDDIISGKIKLRNAHKTNMDPTNAKHPAPSGEGFHTPGEFSSLQEMNLTTEQLASVENARQRIENGESAIATSDMLAWWDFPLVLPEMIELPTEYSLFDDVWNIHYCNMRGESTFYDAEYQRLCTVCQASRIHPADIWPRITNEAICNIDVNDRACLYVDPDTPHGKCQQIALPDVVYQRNPTSCVLVMQDGERVIANEWTSISEMLYGGCECAIDSSSEFAQHQTIKGD